MLLRHSGTCTHTVRKKAANVSKLASIVRNIAAIIIEKLLNMTVSKKLNCNCKQELPTASKKAVS